MTEREKKTDKEEITNEERLIKSEKAMIAGIMEGSPDAVGVAVIRLDCGCRKMAAVAKDGEPASKIIIYRDGAESVCDKCKEDNGDFTRVTFSFIDWQDTELTNNQKNDIELKVLGSQQPVQ